MESWKQVIIAGTLTNYSVSNTGKVINNKTGKLLKPNFKSGYAVVNIFGKAQRVHRLVAVAFIANPDNKPHINHIDGVKDNNLIANLEWCTPRENWIHCKDILGKPTFGSTVNNAVLTKALLARWSNTLNKGITFYKRTPKKPYRVTLTNGKRQITVGYFTDFKAAVRAYKQIFKAVFGTKHTGAYDSALLGQGI